MQRPLLPPSGDLHSLGVLVTRPAHQADSLCRLIERYGGVAIRCPALLISEPQDWTPALAIFDRLAEVARVLPFHALLGFPVELLVGRLSLVEALHGVALQLGWLAVFGALAAVLWRRGLRAYGAFGA